jgi:hypothetical protein
MYFRPVHAGHSGSERLFATGLGCTSSVWLEWKLIHVIVPGEGLRILREV